MLFQSPFRRRGAALAVFVVSAAFSSLSCNNDDSSGAGAVTGPPELTIESIVPTGYAPVPSLADGACVERGVDPGASLAIRLGRLDALGNLVNWTLAGPSGCLGAVQCGYVPRHLESDAGNLQVDAIGTTVTLPLGDLSGAATIRAELLNDQGQPAVGGDGKPFTTAEVHVDLQATCGRPAGQLPPLADGGITDSGTPSDAAPGIPDANAPDAPAVVPDGAVVLPDGAVVLPDGAVPAPDAGVQTDGAVADATIPPPPPRDAAVIDATVVPPPDAAIGG